MDWIQNQELLTQMFIQIRVLENVWALEGGIPDVTLAYKDHAHVNPQRSPRVNLTIHHKSLTITALPENLEIQK